MNVVTPSYFATLGIPLLRGRYLTEQDEHRVVINATMARRGGRRTIAVGQTMHRDDVTFEIAGVVADVQSITIGVARSSLCRYRAAVIYLPMRDSPAAAVFSRRENGFRSAVCSREP